MAVCTVLYRGRPIFRRGVLKVIETIQCHGLMILYCTERVRQIIGVKALSNKKYWHKFGHTTASCEDDNTM